MASTVALNSVLAGACGVGLYYIAIDSHPYAFGACALGLTHAVMGLVGAVTEENENCTKAKNVTTTLMEFAPLPLINIELYRASAESSALALGHGAFIIPLAYDLIANSSEEEDPNTTALKHLTVLGNITSLLFLAFNESNNLYGYIAVTAFISRYGAMLLESYYEGTGEPTTSLANSLFYYLAAEAVAGVWLFPQS